MTKSSAFAKSALAIVAGVMVLGGAATASAQPYGGPTYGSGAGHDGCRRDAGNRGIVGALIGGASGATIGSQVAASGHRSDGSLLGGLLGAFAGAAIGRNTAGCAGPAYAPPPPRASFSSYDSRPAPYATNDDAEGYAGQDAYDRDDGEDIYADGPRQQSFRITERPDANGCTLAERPVYLPDGQVQKRFVRVCLDSRGRYRVVD